MSLQVSIEQFAIQPQNLQTHVGSFGSIIIITITITTTTTTITTTTTTSTTTTTTSTTTSTTSTFATIPTFFSQKKITGNITTTDIVNSPFLILILP